MTFVKNVKIRRKTLQFRQPEAAGTLKCFGIHTFRATANCQLLAVNPFVAFIKKCTFCNLNTNNMNNKCRIAVILFLLPFIATAQKADYKVVFDLTSRDSLDQKSVVRWLNEVSKGNPDAKMEVVMYGQGYNLVTKDRTTVGTAVTPLLANKNISFKVCEISLKNNNIDKSQLLPGVETVPDGIYEIVSKQREGWGYIKAVH